MSRFILLGMLTPILASCAIAAREPVRDQLIIEPTIGIYSKSEVDAINAEAECKRLARNLVQVARCNNRR